MWICYDGSSAECTLYRRGLAHYNLGEFDDAIASFKSAYMRAMVIFMVTKPNAKVPAQISAGAFKATCLELMDAVERTGSSVVVTKRGRAVARLAPVQARPRSAFGLLRGRVHVKGDIVAPIDVRWNAAK